MPSFPRTFQAEADALLEASETPSPEAVMRLVVEQGRAVRRSTRQALLACAAVSTGGRRRLTDLLLRHQDRDHEHAALRDWLAVPEVLNDARIEKTIAVRASRDTEVAFHACWSYLACAPERARAVLRSLDPLPLWQGRLLRRLHESLDLSPVLTPEFLAALCQSDDPETRAWAASVGAGAMQPAAGVKKPRRSPRVQ